MIIVLTAQEKIVCANNKKKKKKSFPENNYNWLGIKKIGVKYN